MKIELSFFLSIALCIGIIAWFVFELFQEGKKATGRKNIQLRREKCNVCASVYFVSPSLEYWRCQFCGSLNK